MTRQAAVWRTAVTLPWTLLGVVLLSSLRFTVDGHQVEWHSYPMPHSVCAPEIGDIANFLARVLED